jgi:hypothetical protein
VFLFGLSSCTPCCQFLWICQFLMAPMLTVSLDMSVFDGPYVDSFSGYVSFWWPLSCQFLWIVSFWWPLCCQFLWICQFWIAPMLPVSLDCQFWLPFWHQILLIFVLWNWIRLKIKIKCILKNIHIKFSAHDDFLRYAQNNIHQVRS